MINYDLDTYPLPIKTNSVVGSNNRVVLYFLTTHEEYAGGFEIEFLSSPKYLIGRCSAWTVFPVALPAQIDKVWKITLSQGDINLVVHCNNFDVLNRVFSNTIHVFGNMYIS